MPLRVPLPLPLTVVFVWLFACLPTEQTRWALRAAVDDMKLATSSTSPGLQLSVNAWRPSALVPTSAPRVALQTSSVPPVRLIRRRRLALLPKTAP